jgi:hypothetical protein
MRYNTMQRSNSHDMERRRVRAQEDSRIIDAKVVLPVLPVMMKIREDEMLKAFSWG